jgi:hypothetical protein
MPEIPRERNGKRILLVEGEPWTCDSLSLFLRVKVYEPHVAASAGAANKPMKRTPWHPRWQGNAGRRGRHARTEAGVGIRVQRGAVRSAH